MAKNLVEQYHAGRAKLTELWHLIAYHMAHERSAAVPETLFRETTQYLVSHPPEPAAGGGVATLPRDLERSVEADRTRIEYARGLFRAVADIVEPIDQAKIMAELQESRDNPVQQSLSELIDELEREPRA
jgi:hypothetical protein